MADDRAYRIHVLFDPEASAYRAVVPELDVEVEADTRGEAVEKAEAAIEAKVEAVATQGEALPPPVDVAATPPGAVTLALAGPLYRELAFHAQRSGLTPDALALQLLAQAIGQLEGRRPARPARAEAPERPAPRVRPQEGDAQPRHHEERGRQGGGRGRGQGQGGQGQGGQGQGGRGGQGRGPGGGRREGYRPEMENQADFLAYVRDMEKGGRGRGGR